MTKDDQSENWNINAFFWILVKEAAETVLEKDMREILKSNFSTKVNTD